MDGLDLSQTGRADSEKMPPSEPDQGKEFFFEKKNQKTFALLRARLMRGGSGHMCSGRDEGF